MSGRNLWHKPFYQPELEDIRASTNCKDRVFWERNYSHHRQRLHNIQNRTVTRPTILKRSYGLREIQQMEKDKARSFHNRTRFNSLPLDSRNTSPMSSRASSRRNSEIAQPTFNRNVSPQGSYIRRKTYPGSVRSFYVSQNFPMIKSRSPRGLQETSHEKLRKVSYKKNFSEFMMRKQLADILEHRECKCGRNHPKFVMPNKLEESVKTHRTLSERLRAIEDEECSDDECYENKIEIDSDSDYYLTRVPVL